MAQVEAPGSSRLGLSIYLPTWWDEPGQPTQWSALRALAQQTEAIGMDAIFVPDHLTLALPDGRKMEFWDGWTLLSAIAEVTSRVRIGPLVTALSLRHPVLLARMANTLDEISGGRVILGLGTGSSVDRAWHVAGYPTNRLFSRFEEAVQIIAPLLRQRFVDFQGKYYQAREATLGPRESRSSHLPIWIGVQGPRMMRLAARWADAINFNPPGYYVMSADDLVGLFTQLEAACHEAGRHPTTIERTALVAVSFAGPDADMSGARAHALMGSTEEIAGRLHALRLAGIDHVFIAIDDGTLPGPMRALPLTTARGLEQFGLVIEVLRHIEGVA